MKLHLVALTLIFLFFLTAIPAQADTLYEIEGTLSIVGHPVCGLSPCTETLNFEFMLGYQLIPSINLYQAYIVPGTAQVTSTGPLGIFQLLGVGSKEPYCGRDVNDLAFFDVSGSEVDLPLCGNLQPTPVVPSFSDAHLYSCFTITCAVDFGHPDRPIPQYGLFLFGTSEVEVTALPEGGSSILLLAIGLAIVVCTRTYLNPSQGTHR